MPSHCTPDTRKKLRSLAGKHSPFLLTVWIWLLWKWQGSPANCVYMFVKYWNGLLLQLHQAVLAEKPGSFKGFYAIVMVQSVQWWATGCIGRHWFPTGARFFSSPQHPDRLWGPLSQWVLAAHEADHSPSSSAKGKNGGNIRTRVSGVVWVEWTEVSGVRWSEWIGVGWGGVGFGAGWGGWV